jgi:hypothetical protein
MNALLDSVERGRMLHQQLRGLKESLVTSALKVYITNRITDEDGMSMDSLREQAVQSKARYLEAEKRSKAAAEIVDELTVEINILKKAVTVPNPGDMKALQTAAGNRIVIEDMQRDDMDVKFAISKVLTCGGTESFRIGALNSAERRPSSSPSSRKHIGSQYQLGHDGDIFGWNQEFRARKTFNEAVPYDKQRHQRPTCSSTALSRYTAALSVVIARKLIWTASSIYSSSSSRAKYILKYKLSCKSCLFPSNERQSDSDSADHEQEIADSFTNFHLLQRPVRRSKGAVAAKTAVLSSTLPSMGTGWPVRPLISFEGSKTKLRASISSGSSPGGVFKKGNTLR